jgi:zinc protease
VVNYKLGGAFNGWLNMILREEKGFTYGARSQFTFNNVFGTFMANSSVRSDATLESVQIFHDEMTDYSEGIPDEDLSFTKSALLKSNARNYETLRALQDMLRDISNYDLPLDYIALEQDILRNMTLEDHMEICRKYIDPEKMFYVVVGDAASQLEPLTELGFGTPALMSLN